jgi:hypothetical protein
MIYCRARFPRRARPTSSSAEIAPVHRKTEFGELSELVLPFWTSKLNRRGALATRTMGRYAWPSIKIADSTKE